VSPAWRRVRLRKGTEVLQGDLADFALPDVLRLLDSASKTGRLRLASGTSEARIDVVDGHVRDASADTGQLAVARRLLGLGLVDGATISRVLDGWSTLPTDLEFVSSLLQHGADPVGIPEVLRAHTVDALFDLLRWSDGSFHFDSHLGPGEVPAAPSYPIGEILGEAEDNLRRWPEIERKTGAADAVVSIPNLLRSAHAGDVDPIGWAMLVLFDGQRTIGEVVELSGLGQYEARRILAGLLDRGTVRVGGASGVGPTEQLLDAHRLLAERQARLRPPTERATAVTTNDQGFAALVTSSTARPEAATPQTGLSDLESRLFAGVEATLSHEVTA
jgi:hypothetical protein